MTDFYCDCSANLYDAPRPRFIHEKIVRARKNHTCCECREIIRPGEQYERTRGKWEHGLDEFKTCLPCTRIRRDYCPCGWIYEGLRVAIWECLGIDYVYGADPDGWEEEDE